MRIYGWMNVLAQENRRHRRLVKKAARLEVKDLLEIASMKGVAKAAGLAATNSCGGASVAASGSPSSRVSGDAGCIRATSSVASGVCGNPVSGVVVHDDAAGLSSGGNQNEQDDNTRVEPVAVALEAGPGASL